jgi:cytochrome P450
MTNQAFETGTVPLAGLRYRLLSRLIHRPGLLRLIARFLRRKPSLARSTAFLVQRDAVAAIFLREGSFSNASHAPNLRSGEFVIAMDPGSRQAGDRAFLTSVLPSRVRFGAVAAAASRSRIRSIRNQPDPVFDLVDDYLVPLVWVALRRTLGPAGRAIACGKGRLALENPAPEFVAELRSLGAHLIVGSVAPADVQRRAGAAGAAVVRRVADQVPALLRWWGPRAAGDAALAQRSAVGLMWVGHPGTVQAGAMAVQELLGRPQVSGPLAKRALELKERAWGDAGFRQEVRQVLLELMRFRPAFPILKRYVSRDTWFEVASDCPVGRARAGAEIAVLPLAAMFDPAAFVGCNPARFQPGCRFKVEADRTFMFGKGGRACVAGEQVIETLVSALIGLLMLERLRWGGGWFSRIEYDGLIIRRMRLRFDR